MAVKHTIALTLALTLAGPSAACGGSAAQQDAEAAPSAADSGGPFAPIVVALQSACVEKQAWVDAFRQQNGRSPMLRVAPVDNQTGRAIVTTTLRNSLESAFLGKGSVEIAAPLEAMAQLQSMQTLSGQDLEGDGPPLGDFILATIFRHEDAEKPDPEHYMVDLRIVAVEGGAIACETAVRQ